VIPLQLGRVGRPHKLRNIRMITGVAAAQVCLQVRP